MKRPQLFAFIITIVLAFVFVVVITTIKETNAKRECSNQGCCPEKKKNDDNIFFMNPLNKFIAVI